MKANMIRERFPFLFVGTAFRAANENCVCAEMRGAMDVSVGDAR